MKPMFNISVMMLLFLTTSTCRKESEVASVPLDNIAIASLGFLKSIQASNEANQLRSPDYSAPFEISKVDRSKNILTITATYPEGCGDSKFTIIWNGLVMESYPEMIFLYLRRTSDCKVAGNATSRVLSINLNACLGDTGLAQRVKIILCNTSKKANSENSDIPVSSN
ncbi:MAG: hypothetical protein M0Q53_03890 [Prolixibacteraceae bacterium]|jgi:hypothetical protein|nr:hypothetical protein [Prolixibacteraceae bacterium]